MSHNNFLSVGEFLNRNWNISEIIFELAEDQVCFVLFLWSHFSSIVVNLYQSTLCNGVRGRQDNATVLEFYETQRKNVFHRVARLRYGIPSFTNARH